MKDFFAKLFSRGTKESAVAVYLREQFLKLSMADGKPGLSLGDLEAVLGRVKNASVTLSTNQEKAEAVALWVNAKFGNRISPWIISQLVQIGYLFAKEKGIVK